MSKMIVKCFKILSVIIFCLGCSFVQAQDHTIQFNSLAVGLDSDGAFSLEYDFKRGRKSFYGIHLGGVYDLSFASPGAKIGIIGGVGSVFGRIECDYLTETREFFLVPGFSYFWYEEINQPMVEFGVGLECSSIDGFDKFPLCFEGKLLIPISAKRINKDVDEWLAM